MKSVGMWLLLGSLSTGMAYADLSKNESEIDIVQQTGICQGIVKDATGESVIGASVIVKGTTNGTITDLDGNFSLPNVPKGSTIKISFVGYKTLEVKWNGSPLNIILKEDSEMLDEVVVVIQMQYPVVLVVKLVLKLNSISVVQVLLVPDLPTSP